MRHCDVQRVQLAALITALSDFPHYQAGKQSDSRNTARQGQAFSILHFMYIQGVSRLVDITAASDFLGLCDQKSSYKHVSDFGRLRSYDRLKLGIEGNDY